MRLSSAAVMLCLLQTVTLPLLSVNSKGSLVIIGGALRNDNRRIYSEIIRLGGGPDRARLIVIPAASGTPAKNGAAARSRFISYGIAPHRARVLPLAVTDDPSTPDTDESTWKNNAFSPDLCHQAAKATVVFFVGGDQMRYHLTLLKKDGSDTPLLAEIRAIYRRGGVIAGTSAGAAIMSDPMIVRGTSLDALLNRQESAGADPLELVRGAGFIKGLIVDQHFIKRGRMGRLLTALLRTDSLGLGLGIDEDTAVVYREPLISVIGTSGILIIEVPPNMPMPENPVIDNITLHYLHSGDTYSLKTRKFTIHPARTPAKPGNEYFQNSRLLTDVFAKDCLRDLLTENLADCTCTEARGMAFSLTPRNRGTGIILNCSKNNRTRSFWGLVNGNSTYSVLHVQANIRPIRIKINLCRPRP